jgi:hypothetical protein
LNASELAGRKGKELKKLDNLIWVFKFKRRVYESCGKLLWINNNQTIIVSRDNFQFAVYKGTGLCVLES